MRDLLPAPAAAAAQVSAVVQKVFALHGYERVVTPAFEYADVLQRGLATVDRRELLRFVEPESGEVALLRPDITPQVARIIATRLQDRPGPWRLSYQGTVLRQRRGRARRQRQFSQAGIECVGLADRYADLEVIGLAVEACRQAGLEGFRIELGHVGIGEAALTAVPEALRDSARDALRRKDAHALEAVLSQGKLTKSERNRLLSLVNLFGGDEVIATARRQLRGAKEQLDALAEVYEGLRGIAPDVDLGIDLGELRGHGYYTGVSFAILAEGPGAPIGAGGRYDGLLRQFGADAPATGFGLDLDNLLWALGRQGHQPKPGMLRFVAASDPSLTKAIAAFRKAGVAVAWLPGDARRRAVEFARAWGYDGVLRGGNPPRVIRAQDGASRRLPEISDPTEATELQRWVRSSE